SRTRRSQRPRRRVRSSRGRRRRSRRPPQPLPGRRRHLASAPTIGVGCLSGADAGAQLQGVGLNGALGAPVARPTLCAGGALTVTAAGALAPKDKKACSTFSSADAAGIRVAWPPTLA